MGGQDPLENEDLVRTFRTLPAGANVLLPSGFGRPQYRAALTYKFKNNDNRQLIFSLDRNSNYFALLNRDFEP